MTRRKQAFGYVRVSGKGQVNGHGPTRQRDDIQSFADGHGYEVVRYFEDAHTGTEADRPAFVDMLSIIMANGVRVVIVESLDRLSRESLDRLSRESLDRLSRDLMIQTQLIAKLAAEGVTLIAANTGEDVTAAMHEDPMRRALIQIQGVFAELDKSLLVRKLRKGREQKRKAQGKCEGRKAFGERPGEQAIVDRMLVLRRKPRGGERRSYREIAEILNTESVPTRSGCPWSASTVGGIIARERRPA